MIDFTLESLPGCNLKLAESSASTEAIDIFVLSIYPAHIYLLLGGHFGLVLKQSYSLLHLFSNFQKIPPQYLFALNIHFLHFDPVKTPNVVNFAM